MVRVYDSNGARRNAELGDAWCPVFAGAQIDIGTEADGDEVSATDAGAEGVEDAVGLAGGVEIARLGDECLIAFVGMEAQGTTRRYHAPGEQAVVGADLPTGSRTDDMDGECYASEGLNQRAEIAETTDEEALRFAGGVDGTGAVRGREDKYFSGDDACDVLGWRVAKIEALDTNTRAFAAQER